MHRLHEKGDRPTKSAIKIQQYGGRLLIFI
uniref:Uncharacterized protein n=1 Tax=Anguilla anguilla TaxID=7936 RepID=A0A0E9PL61_ANGAN